MILVDDLMHNGYRMEYLTPLLRQEQVEIDRLIVGIMSGRGKDRMRLQNIETECEYFIPAMRYWQTESLLYPFIGGDSVLTSRKTEMLPTINLILPYKYPHFFSGVPKRAIYALSETVLGQHAGDSAGAGKGASFLFWQIADPQAAGRGPCSGPGCRTGVGICPMI